MTTIRVLIAEDEMSVADTFRSILLLSGRATFDVRIEARADRVLKALDEFKPHVVLLDDKFQGNDVGVSYLLPSISGARPEIRIIVVTAHRGSAVAPILFAGAYGLVGWLDKVDGKHVSPDELVDTVLEAYRRFPG